MSALPRTKLNIMTWNIENIGATKIKRAPVLKAIAQTILAHDVDVAIIVEVRNIFALQALLKVINKYAVAQGLAPYQIGFFSPFSPTATQNTTQHDHGEFYGVLVRNPAFSAISGFRGPVDFKRSFLEDGLMVQGLPGGSTVSDKAVYTNILPLVNSTIRRAPRATKAVYFLGGRPPSGFAITALGKTLWVIATHLRPSQTAYTQLRLLLEHPLATEQVDGAGFKYNLMITGDFNIPFNKLDGNKPGEALKAQMASVGMTRALTAGSTHVQNALWDNFITRGINATEVKAISPATIMNYLNRNEILAFKTYVEEAAKKNTQKDVNDEPYKGQLLAANALAQQKHQGQALTFDTAEKLAIFRKISDHYPIFISIDAIN